MHNIVFIFILLFCMYGMASSYPHKKHKHHKHKHQTTSYTTTATLELSTIPNINTISVTPYVREQTTGSTIPTVFTEPSTVTELNSTVTESTMKKHKKKKNFKEHKTTIGTEGTTNAEEYTTISNGNVKKKRSVVEQLNNNNIPENNNINNYSSGYNWMNTTYGTIAITTSRNYASNNRTISSINNKDVISGVYLNNMTNVNETVLKKFVTDSTMLSNDMTTKLILNKTENIKDEIERKEMIFNNTVLNKKYFVSTNDPIDYDRNITIGTVDDTIQTESTLHSDSITQPKILSTIDKFEITTEGYTDYFPEIPKENLTLNPFDYRKFLTTKPFDETIKPFDYNKFLTIKPSNTITPENILNITNVTPTNGDVSSDEIIIVENQILINNDVVENKKIFIKTNKVSLDENRDDLITTEKLTESIDWIPVEIEIDVIMSKEMDDTNKTNIL